jgi:hypothetical protein
MVETRREGSADSEATMRISGSWQRRQIAGCLVLVLFVPFADAAPSPQQETNSSQQAVEGLAAQAPSQNLDSGAMKVNAEVSPAETLPNSPGSMLLQTVDDNRQSRGQQSTPKQRQPGTQEPVGTAAAQPVNTLGVAGSKPAGAAIAPAKQRRARSVLIKVGAILGAGVAIGTVVALSNSSPSKPAVAH